MARPGRASRGRAREPRERTPARGTRGNKRGQTQGARAPKRVRVEPAPEDDPVDEAWVRDAQDMASEDEDVGALQFLSRTHLPDVSAKGEQGRQRERVRDEKRRQRQQLDAHAAPAPESSSDESTDMEGASESEIDSDESMDDSEIDSDESMDDSDLGSDDEDADDVSTGDDDGALDSDLSDEASEALEAHYLQQAQRRERRAQADREAKAQLPLPIRTEDGIVHEGDSDDPDAAPSGSRAVYERGASDDDEGDDEAAAPYMSSAAHSTRFGMKAPYELMAGVLSDDAAERAQSLQAAREQIAQLSSNIIGDPEMGTSWLQRLLVFAQRKVSPPPGASGRKVPVNVYIRQLALLSLLAVFIDIIPGYRIRALSEQEERERVSQDVARRREWEQSLVRLYREFLECCEAEIRQRDAPLAPVALRCYCTLLVRVPHFNYRKNLLASVIGLMSRAEWTDASEQCATALQQLLRGDRDGEIGLELVTLLYRMIRERKLAVHANVLDVLVHLRLRDELRRTVRQGPMGQRAAPTSAENRRADPKQVRKGLAVHRSKKQVKRDKELRGIEAEMREADATVDVEERESRVQTLKLVFALYFRLLKSEVSMDLLASALEGIVQFAPHVSADFFRDLVQVLRTRLLQAKPAHDHDTQRLSLLCVVAALELQAGQGGALELDMAEFYTALYQLLWPLAVATQVEDGESSRGGVAGLRRWSLASLLFHALEVGLVKAPRHTLHVLLDRTAAILRRLLSAAMHWPTTSTLRALQLAHAILARTASMDARFDALLDNRDAVHDGQHDAWAEQPESARVLASGEPCWELLLLSRSHANAQVRETATALLQWTR